MNPSETRKTETTFLFMSGETEAQPVVDVVRGQIAQAKQSVLRL